jgi:hypothetical protein
VGRPQPWRRTSTVTAFCHLLTDDDDVVGNVGISDLSELRKAKAE